MRANSLLSALASMALIGAVALLSATAPSGAFERPSLVTAPAISAQDAAGCWIAVSPRPDIRAPSSQECPNMAPV